MLKTNESYIILRDRKGVLNLRERERASKRERERERDKKRIHVRVRPELSLERGTDRCFSH